MIILWILIILILYFFILGLLIILRFFSVQPLAWFINYSCVHYVYLYISRSLPNGRDVNEIENSLNCFGLDSYPSAQDKFTLRVDT